MMHEHKFTLPLGESGSQARRGQSGSRESDVCQAQEDPPRPFKRPTLPLRGRVVTPLFIAMLLATTMASDSLAQRGGRDPHLAYAYPAGCERGTTEGSTSTSPPSKLVSALDWDTRLSRKPSRAAIASCSGCAWQQELHSTMWPRRLPTPKQRRASSRPVSSRYPRAGSL